MAESEQSPTARQSGGGESIVEVLPGRNLKQAVATALVLLAIIIVCYAGGPTWFFWLAAVVVTLALLELLIAVAHSGRRPAIPFALACGAGMMVSAYFAPSRPDYLVGLAGATVFGSFLLALRPNRGTSPASDVAWTVLGVFWITGGGAAAASMLSLPDGLNLLLAHIAITALDDMAAYFVGTRFGRRKLAPSLSPAKSWEGAAAGFLVAVATGAALGALIDGVGPGHGAAIGGIIGTLAPAGDLAESMAKRELGIKDSGRLLPGHGGFLDRLDAIIFCVPPVLLYLRLVVA